ncbi:MAG: Heat-inducible transcription repressor HrcA [uncultured Friedmanniella sp.]|uniref:Heat-inducible transcription repressor HrcA n=1 Tax=uncultured Friedmanniella sp. TaxID=335381 RepID=A0A6J4JWN9_9ACTN|nr:heat-inducible transcriptional repressor HrcA [uncultured Friedmanniella sp.]CAA9289321.1 MAG: Heat-inducible transcription repressor HrcA [uncultured Friedmanniella sp.]
MDDRKLEVLRAIVTDYVSSQEPVGSKALVERHDLGVSPATVRNDMAALEEEGYITQPHTSAGRIPTDKGYRLFVDRLGTVKPLSAAEQKAIHTFLSGAADLDDVLHRTVRLLAQVTQQVAIVQYPTLSHSTVRHVEVVSLSTSRMLLILITSTGRIEQRSLELPDHETETLAQLRASLNAAAVGHPSAVAAVRLSGLVDELPPELSGIGQAAVATLLEMLSSDASSRMVVGGMPNLTRYGSEFETTVKPVLEALEEQVVLLKLMGEATTADAVTVRIGQENPYKELQSTSVVASGYGSQLDIFATLGVVGPTRMDYPSTMASVRAVARYVGRFLSEG